MYGRYEVTYDTLCANWTYGVWTDTFIIGSKRSTNPNCQFLQEPVQVMVPCMTEFGAGYCPSVVPRTRIGCQPRTEDEVEVVPVTPGVPSPTGTLIPMNPEGSGPEDPDED